MHSNNQQGLMRFCSHDVFHRRLTENPHIAGRSVDEEDLVDFISSRFAEAGLTVETHPYDVLLSYPDDSDSNFVAIQTGDGKSIDVWISTVMI